MAWSQFNVGSKPAVGGFWGRNTPELDATPFQTIDTRLCQVKHHLGVFNPCHWICPNYRLSAHVHRHTTWVALHELGKVSDRLSTLVDEGKGCATMQGL